MICANHPDRERQAFCQNCGKPLCRECARIVGQAVFCEPCLEARLAAANAATGAIPNVDPATFGAGPATSQTTYQAVPGGGPTYRSTGTGDGLPYAAGSATPRPGTPNPAVAALLGFIPGVGAMYNGQYAKGIVHLIVFAVLVSLADQNGIFGLFVAAWIFYQAIEAYHTARARRDGTPQPNPFGLNDIGERFGFGRAWPGPGAPADPYTAPPYVPPAPAAYPPQSPVPPPITMPGTNPYASPDQPQAAAPSNSPYATSIPDQAPFRQASYQPVAPLDSAFSPAAVPASLPASGSLPIGAVILIALGLLFLLGNTRWLGGLPVHILLPSLLIGVGVWVFFRRLQTFGGFLDDGSPAYRLRVLQAVQGSVWIVLVGVLFLLDTLHILSWGRSWPLFIIVAGVVVFLQRTAAATLARTATYVPVPTPTPVNPYAATSGVSPDPTKDQERP